MKSFSFKALALSFAVIAVSANAGITDTVKEYATAAKNGVVNTIRNTDRKLFGKLKVQLDQNVMSNTFGEEVDAYTKGGYRPFSTIHPYLRNGYARAAVVAATVAAVSAAVYKGYKHFTKPAADATEGENEANTEVVA